MLRRTWGLLVFAVWAVTTPVVTILLGSKRCADFLEYAIRHMEEE